MNCLLEEGREPRSQRKTRPIHCVGIVLTEVSGKDLFVLEAALYLRSVSVLTIAFVGL